MHKLMKYICDELEELERKVGKDGKLSMAEIEYADKLAHMKKNLLKAEEMWEDSEYNEDGGSSYRGGSSYVDGENMQYRRGGSYRRDGSSYARGRGRNARRDSMGRYSSADGMEDMISELRELMQEAPDQQTRQVLGEEESGPGHGYAVVEVCHPAGEEVMVACQGHDQCPHEGDDHQYHAVVGAEEAGHGPILILPGGVIGGIRSGGDSQHQSQGSE